MADEGEKKPSALERAVLKGPYTQKSIRARIEALFLDNIGKVVTRDQIVEVARDPKTGVEPENWHQRLSELRTDKGYTIQTYRDRADLQVQDYLMPSPERRPNAYSRAKVSQNAWKTVLSRAGNRCEWQDGDTRCPLCEGDVDPVGGGTVRLTPDHKTPHASGFHVDVDDPDQWQALCGRHQVVKKNYWDHMTGKLNVRAIVQAAPEREKREIYKMLKEYYGDE